MYKTCLNLTDLYYTGAAYTVAFSAGANVDITTYDAGETVMFQNILYAVGGGYEKITGVFTVPLMDSILYFVISWTATLETFGQQL